MKTQSKAEKTFRLVKHKMFTFISFKEINGARTRNLKL
jgi:hypothetical protein